MQSALSASRRLFVVFILFSVSASMPLLHAQQEAPASITGAVVDARGAAVAHAAVEAKNQATGAVSKVTADGSGHFAIRGIPPGRYTLTVTAQGFASASRVAVASAAPAEISVTLGIGSVEQNIEVRAIAGDSIAGEHALSQDTLDAEVPKSEISSEFIREFTPPDTDFTEIIQIAPGIVSYNSNGVGLGQGTVYFRGFPDGNFDYTWDGIPFNDTNNPTHHSWVFFPGVWIGSVDFDRSPGTASTIGPATYGGSINLLSREVPSEQSIQPQVSYSSFNTLLLDGNTTPACSARRRTSAWHWMSTACPPMASKPATIFTRRPLVRMVHVHSLSDSLRSDHSPGSVGAQLPRELLDQLL